MISKEEIRKIALEKGLDAFQIEKDYVLGWILAAISEHQDISKFWLLKGGTCIRKCFIEDYRYSEDLDYTIIDQPQITPATLEGSFNDIAKWIYKKSGIEIDTKRTLFDITKNSANQLIIQGRIFYHGSASPFPPRQWPRIKFDLTTDEVVVRSPLHRKIIHPYSDYLQIQDYLVTAYDFYDLLSEKIRALFERTRPRDLYDVVEIFASVIKIDLKVLKPALVDKCQCHFKQLTSLDLKTLKLTACKAGWKDQLSHQLAKLPSFEEYYDRFILIYNKLGLKDSELELSPPVTEIKNGLKSNE
jgi:predicted nucleotidyltransferase component of viral defense system